MSSLPNWSWWVDAKLSHYNSPSKYYATAPHRAGAKQTVVKKTEDSGNEVEWIGEAEIPPETWDCPKCHTHEAAMKLPNRRTKWDWECMECFARFIGHPQDPEVVLE